MSNLNVGNKEIQKNVRPQLLNLERELKELNHQLLDGAKRLEGLEEKIFQTQKSVDLARAAYQDKFNLNPDQISGSPVKKVEYEYTAEYEKLRDHQLETPSEEPQSVMEEEPEE